MKPETRSYLLLSAVILVWGVNWPVMKTGLHYMTPLWFGVARLSLGALCLLVLAVLRRRLYWPGLGDLPILLSLGVLQMGGYLALISSVIALGEPFTAANLIGLALISFGLLLVLAAPPASQPVPA